MKTVFYKTAAEFLDSAKSALVKNEARYSLIFGVSKRLLKDPHAYGPSDPWFCVVSAGHNIRAAAIRTPPYKIILAHFNGDTAAAGAALVDAVSEKELDLYGVSGEKELAGLFAEFWYRKHGAAIKPEVTVNQRIYRLDKVNDVPLSPGRLRPATGADTELVKKWKHAFYVSTHGASRGNTESDIVPLLNEGAVFFWEDETPVCMAVKYRPTDKSMDVSTVYTPPEMRGKGYATSCVAELSRNILQSGYEFCTLYTNLANPTSNAIYMKIGFKPVHDCVEYTFETP
jgi:predicted GNAT family acetyltransferase